MRVVDSLALPSEAHARCWPVNISWDLCAELLKHKGCFQKPGQSRLSGNRDLSVQLEMQTIFSAAKIELGEGAYQRVA